MVLVTTIFLVCNLIRITKNISHRKYESKLCTGNYLPHTIVTAYPIRILFFFTILLATTTNAQVQIIGPNAGSLGNTPEAERAKKASANIKAAIEFLNTWGLNNEADNIQQWFNDRIIYLDMDQSGASTSTTSGAITIDCFLALGGSKGSTNLHHKFDPANAADKELIAELAFTLVHEKVHAHQSYTSFILGREENETEAYNKEIKDEDEVIKKMIDELEKARKNADKQKMKDLTEWINAVIETKLKAIYTFDSNYTKSRKKNWPDDFLEKLKKLRESIHKLIQQFNNYKEVSDIDLDNMKMAAREIQQYEYNMPAIPMPEYWIKVNRPTNTSYTIKTFSSGLEKHVIHYKQNTYEIYLPLSKNAGQLISGTIHVIADSNKRINLEDSSSNNQLKLEIENQGVPVVNNNFTCTLPADTFHKYVYMSLYTLSGNLIGTTIISYSTFPSNGIKENNFRIPMFSQKNEPLKIEGLFDGSYQNTSCLINNEKAQVIAESPQQAFVLPNNKLLGNVICKIADINNESEQQINIIDLQVEVQSTSLRKGEKTKLLINVQGLQNMKSNAFLYLNAKGPIVMNGGNKQIITIQSTDIPSNGIWTASYPIKAIKTGNFEISAEIKDSITSN